MKFVTITLQEYAEWRGNPARREEIRKRVLEKEGTCQMRSPGGVFLAVIDAKLNEERKAG